MNTTNSAQSYNSSFIDTLTNPPTNTPNNPPTNTPTNTLGGPARPTDGQERLFGMMARFSAGTVIESLSCAYNMFGNLIYEDSITQIILPVLEKYFNIVAANLCEKDDTYVNIKFEEMAGCGIDYNPLDLLNIVVIMTLNIAHNMELKNYKGSVPDMALIYEYLIEIAMKNSQLAANLTGCRDSDNVQVKHGDRIFTFSMDKYVQSANGPVKLTQL